ncbi:transcription-repair coupling factor [Varunaivibrio sulfuroxidans]|uniref:transcription-repair coupling factor n=1 Tax=Varunaivibrio sulfuroxidans TaxID=1773489 RepID=UPI001FB43245|nr:transcription-repair coupling factor [Varunaivibrio sulfuroxidans]
MIFVARDDVHLARMGQTLRFFAPDSDIIEFPAWDCLPYDRVSPSGDIVASRIATLTQLARPGDGRARAILTTISSCLQRVPPRAVFCGALLRLNVGGSLSSDMLVDFLENNGYGRSATVMEPGEYAVRGGIVDVFPPGASEPLRLDFFGDTLDSLRHFDPTTQMTSAHTATFTLAPVSEIVLNEDTKKHFRTAYRELFGAVPPDDTLYEAVSAGRRHMGMEHWIALFYDKLETLFDYLPDARIVLDHQIDTAVEGRHELIREYYAARLAMRESKSKTVGGRYNPVPPEKLYLSAKDWRAALRVFPVVRLSPFAVPEGPNTVDADGRGGRDFSDARVQGALNVFDALAAHIRAMIGEERKVLISAFSEGTAQRIKTALTEHGFESLVAIDDWSARARVAKHAAALCVVGIERGFVAPGLAVISEQDILGDRMTRERKNRKKVSAENIIADASSLGEGDYVVHGEHGIGRFEGLHTVQVGGADHDCLKLVYAGDDRLFLPVENIDVLSRYGSHEAGAHLDRLGGAGWQARKAHMKQRLKDMAENLIKIAAGRELKNSAKIVPDPAAFNEFCARFPYVETDDQSRAIEDVLGDLAGGRPTDRLVCGDVGFGKTEVALRAAFATVMTGRQVAVVVPTTLLCRQHYHNFKARFADFPVNVAQLSRLVPPKTSKRVKTEMKDGRVDIVIGTHALLAKDVGFKELGLLIVDEEQHFGVAHKEKLKGLKSDVHVLTLSATPIPRTLQLALSGVREMSLIATPPVDRLAVRTFILPFDPVIVREAIMRERFRGGQIFYVCPRIQDQPELTEALRDLVPEARIAVVNGQMPIKQLEEMVSDFQDGKFDVLLSTNIIESGLDMTSVNTIIIHRADRFGLAQLYQLRGRVGRSKTRAYAYLTLPPGKTISTAAQKRLEVMQTLDSLGAGFMLASHDLDIRGAGNLLGGEQSGHIREVGIELYQQMLEEAVAEARGAQGGATQSAGDGDWSPQVSCGVTVMIPETYVGDLSVRMDLYRRVARLHDDEQSEAFAAEMIDRFGPLPEAVENLLKTVEIKRLCRKARVEKLESGPKGAVVSFRDNSFPNPEALVQFIVQQVGTAKLRPDHKLVFKRDWETPADRLKGVRHLARELAALVTP